MWQEGQYKRGTADSRDTWHAQNLDVITATQVAVVVVGPPGLPTANKTSTRAHGFTEPTMPNPSAHDAKHLSLRCQMLDPMSEHCSQHRAQAAIPGWLQGSPEPSSSLLLPAFTQASASSYKCPPSQTRSNLTPPKGALQFPDCLHFTDVGSAKS